MHYERRKANAYNTYLVLFYYSKNQILFKNSFFEHCNISYGTLDITELDTR